MFRDPVRDGGLVDWMNETIERDYRHHAVIAMRNPPGRVIVRTREGADSSCRRPGQGDVLPALS